MYQPIFLSALSKLPAYKSLFQALPAKHVIKNDQAPENDLPLSLKSTLQKAYPSLKSLIEDTTISGKKLGTGYYGTVYSIPKLDAYVLKIMHDKHLTETEKRAPIHFESILQDESFPLN